jgi:hypothetical protein
MKKTGLNKQLKEKEKAVAAMANSIVLDELKK